MLASVGADGQAGTGESYLPRLSADGRYLAFRSMATNLVAGDLSERKDIYVRDLAAGVTWLASAAAGGTTGNGWSVNPAISADGRVVAFNSTSTDLTPGDLNDLQDVFVFRVPSPAPADTDSDGLADEWERAWFGDLSRDGQADSDGDGLSDKQEFLAGTNPLEPASALRVQVILSLAPERPVIVWDAVAGKSYGVQYKETLADPAWRDLPGQPLPYGENRLALRDNSNNLGAVRFYRVALTSP